MTDVRHPGLLDRVWRGNIAVALVEQIAVPSLEDLRAAVLDLAQRGPQTRIGVCLTDSGAWIHDRGRLAEVVAAMVHSDVGQGDITTAVLDFMAAHPVRGPEPTPGLHLGVAGERLAYLSDHELWDGGSLSKVVFGICAFARTGQQVELLEQPAVRWAFERALLHTFASPTRIRQLLRERSRASREPGLGQPAGPPELDPSPAIVKVDVSREARREVRQWARAHCPGVSDAILTLALMRGALVRVGLVRSPAVSMVVDLRRYLPHAHQTRVRGNFIAGLQMALPLGSHPLEMQDRLEAVLNSGRPLAAFALSALKDTKRRYVPGVRAFPGHPYSHVFMGSRIGGSDGRSIPWTGPVRRMTGWTNPAGLTGITAIVTQLVGGWQLNLSHYAGWTDSNLLRDAGALISQDPLGIIGA